MISQYIKQIRAETWWSEESPGVPMFCLWAQQFVRQSKYWHPKLPDIIFVYFKNDFLLEETPESQKITVWEYVLNIYIKNKSRFNKIYKYWIKVSQKIISEGKYIEDNFNKIENAVLAKSLMRFTELVREHWRITWVQESSDVFSTNILPKLIQSEISNFTYEQAVNHAMSLSAPQQLSFIEEQHIEILKLCIKYYQIIKKNKSNLNCSKSLQDKIRSVSQKYVWLLSNYREAKSYKVQNVWQQLRFECQHKTIKLLKVELSNLQTKVSRVKTEKKHLLKKHKLSKKLLASLALLTYWAGLIDERKRVAQIASYYSEIYAKELSKRFNLDVNLVKYLTPEEQCAGLLDKKMPNKNVLVMRRKKCVLVTSVKNGKVHEDIVTGEGATKLWKAMFKLNNKSEIKGQVAFAPVSSITGKAQVILDTNRQKFETGRILVTTMTRPEFVPLIRRAKAIVTDEGGITSHAAIISRELGIPCIIGTKQASKFFKSGQTITLDLLKGTVK